MKILFLTGSFPPPMAGGSIEYIFNIISHLPPNSVVVHTGNTDPVKAAILDKQLNQKVVRSRFISTVVGEKQRPKWIARLIALSDYLVWPVLAVWMVIRVRPHIIHIGEVGFVGFTAILMRKLFGIPFVVYTYGEDISILRTRRLHKWWLLYIIRNANALVTVCDFTKQLLIECGVHENRISKIVPAVGHRKLVSFPQSKIDEIRIKYGLVNKKVLLTVGRLQERKNHISVINALTKITRIHPDVCYVIVGTGPQENLLKNHTKKMGMENKVIFTGLIDDGDLSCLYDICEIFIMPHRQIPETMDTEGCPTVFLEASAHGKPVVGGNAGGVTDAILNEITGFIIDGTQTDRLSDVINQLLENPNLARKMGKAGREYVSTLTPEKNAMAVWNLSQLLIQK